jgi:glutaredoxin-related protein
MPDGWTVMAKIAIYTTNTCGFCAMAKDLLRRKGAQFEEIDVSFDAEQRSEMTARADVAQFRRFLLVIPMSGAVMICAPLMQRAGLTPCWPNHEFQSRAHPVAVVT